MRKCSNDWAQVRKTRQKMLESRPADALVKLVLTVVTVLTVLAVVTVLTVSNLVTVLTVLRDSEKNPEISHTLIL